MQREKKRTSMDTWASMWYWTGLLLLLVGLASVRVRPCKSGGHCNSRNASGIQDGRSFAKGTKKRLYPWPAFFTCTAFYCTGTPFSARAIHFTRSQNALLKTTSRDPFHCREYALSPGDVRPQAFPSTVSSKFCTYSKSFFFLSSPKQNGSIVNRSSAALFRTSTNPGKMMLL